MYTQAPQIQCLGSSRIFPGRAKVRREVTTSAVVAPPAPYFGSPILWARNDGLFYQNSNGTTLATADTDPIGYWQDYSGNGNHLLQATSGKRPLLKTNRINGGFYKKMEDPNMNHPSVVIAVENIREAMKKVRDAGGKVLGEPMEIPTIGQYVSFIDTEGNRVSLLQPSTPM